MNIFDKMRLSSLAKKGDYSKLLIEVDTTRDFECPNYILDLLAKNDNFQEILGLFDRGLKIKRATEFKIFSRIGDVTAIDRMISFSSLYNFPEFVSTILTIYKKYETPELRLKIFVLTKAKIAEKTINKWGVTNFSEIEYLTDLLNELNGLDIDSCEFLIPQIALHEEKVSKILMSFGPQVIEVLLPWIDFTQDKRIPETIWHQGQYNSMEDTYGEGWTEIVKEQYPIASCVKKVLWEITGKRFNSTAYAKTWWKQHKAEILQP